MNWNYEKQVGNVIRQYRESKGITQEQLSAKLQVGGLAKMEIGERHIYLDKIVLLSQILETSFQDLLI